MELSHLKIAAETLRRYEGREWEQLFLFGSDFPSLLKLKNNEEYVRSVLKTVRLTGKKEDIVPVDELSDDASFFKYQKAVVTPTAAASHTVIEKRIKQAGEDYRAEDAPHPDKLLRSREKDNVEIGRTKGV